MKRGQPAGIMGRTTETEPAKRHHATTPHLEIVVESEAGVRGNRHIAIDSDVVRVGSHPSNECVLTDPQVSRLHCQIRSGVDGWHVVDTGSLNGTRIRGVRIHDAELSLPECVIELGQSRIRVQGLTKEMSEIRTSPVFGSMYGGSAVMARLFERIERVAKSESNVLIEGESGTGKELIAAEIVRRSLRVGQPLIIVDCGAISETVFESEVFGHVKGAFTGAEQTRVGAFEAANGGTVFLDEIGELPLASQPKLLRALANREIRRMGENQARKIDVRVIAATNRRLDAEVNSGRFREDLYFRLGVVRIDAPPLRDRIEDLPLLVGAFLDSMGASSKHDMFTDEIMDRLRAHTWPGNVRELKNYVERFLIFEDPSLQEEARDVSPASQAPPAAHSDLNISFRSGKNRAIEDFERTYLTALISWAGGNVSRAARKANLDRMYLHRLLQRHGLRPPAPLDD